MLFYQTAFKNQRLKFTVGEYNVKVINIFNHLANLYPVVVLRAEILADTVFERLCLADIYDFTAAVLHQIYPGSKRELHGLFPQDLKLVVHRFTSG